MIRLLAAVWALLGTLLLMAYVYVVVRLAGLP